MPIRVVNVIPQFRSGETNFDSEPSVAVNPSNPQQVVLTSFTPDTGAVVTTGSYFFSTDGGQTWALNSVIPGGNSVLNTGDISVRFGGSSGACSNSDHHHGKCWREVGLAVPGRGNLGLASGWTW